MLYQLCAAFLHHMALLEMLLLEEGNVHMLLDTLEASDQGWDLEGLGYITDMTEQHHGCCPCHEPACSYCLSGC